MKDRAREVVARVLDRALLGAESARPLASFRIAAVAVFLPAFVTHIGALDAYFSDAATLGGSYAREAFPSRWSLFFTWSSPAAVRLLFAVGVVAHLTWLVGLWTRASAVVCWVLWVSLIGRHPLLYSLGDQLLLALCTVLAVLPSGNAFSLDARRRGERPAPVWCRRLVQLQLATMYVHTGALKTGSTWWSEGSALYYASVHPYNRHFDLAPLLAELQPWFLRPMTWAVLAFELGFGAFLVLHWLRSSGVRRLPDLRPVYLGFGVAMHVGIALLLYVAWFSPLCLAAYVAFIEPDDLERSRRRWFRRASP